MLYGWNEGGGEYQGACLHELFEQQVERTPDAVGLVFREERLSYRELNERANRVAEYLRAAAVGAESIVGLEMERCAAMVVAMLGVLKAGAAYLPLDPAYPEERRGYMKADAGMELLLTQEVVEGLGCEEWRGGNVKNEISGENLAYVIYTSGSTGRPKGVCVRQSGLGNLAQAVLQGPGMNSETVMVAVTTLAFDIAGLELLVPLVAGGCVVVVSREVASDGARLAATLGQEQATMLQGTPATWRLLLESGWRGGAGFKALCGGEALTAELAGALLQAGCELWNLYGPTETTIWSTWEQVQTAAEIRIGRGLANTRVYVLDQGLEPVGIGVVGELYIGGAGVARGYQGETGLTAWRFVPDAWSGLGGSRLYRTGDQVRWGADGRLEYVGRVDQQVKVRGHRIEPGEIESALGEHEAVQQSVVLARVEGEQQLVAYVVWAAGRETSVGELRQHLRKRLPEYMVPNLFVALEQMPLTANGKVDRKQLAAVKLGAQQLGAAAYLAPRTATEELLCERPA